MAEWLVLGGPVFWAVLLVWIIALFVSVETEYGIFAFLSTIVYGVLLYFVFHVDLPHLLYNHPILILVGIALYFPIGAAWSFFRWYMFVHSKLELYTDMRNEWLSSKGQTSFTEIPDHLKEEWIKFLEEGDGKAYGSNRYAYGSNKRRDLLKPPLVRDNKSRILRWIGYWPVSAMAWAFNDMIRGFCKMIYGRIANWLQSIANSIFEKVKKDLPEDYNK
jgi:hypothetical protein